MREALEWIASYGSFWEGQLDSLDRFLAESKRRCSRGGTGHDGRPRQARASGSREQVYRTWTEPDLFKRWFTPPGNASVTADLDVRPGGEYRITLERTELVPGRSYIVGSYLEVEPPERLVFTFGWEEPPPVEGLEALSTLDSRVTVLSGTSGRRRRSASPTSGSRRMSCGTSIAGGGTPPSTSSSASSELQAAPAGVDCRRAFRIRYI